jgi:hypothetical protein
VGLGVVSDEIDVADDVEHARPDDLQPEMVSWTRLRREPSG